RLLLPTIVVGAALLASAGRARAQGPSSLAPVATIVEPAFASWYADDASDASGAGDTRHARSAAVALPELHSSSDGRLAGIGLAGNRVARRLRTPLQTVAEQGIDPSNISWGIDRNSIGNPSTSANTASNVAALAARLGAPTFALLTQPGVHGFRNVVR